MWESMSKFTWGSRHAAVMTNLKISNSMPHLVGVCDDPEAFKDSALLAFRTVLEQLGLALNGRTPQLQGMVTPELKERLFSGDLSWQGAGISWSILEMKPPLLSSCQPRVGNPFNGTEHTFEVEMVVETTEEYKRGAQCVHVSRHHNVTFSRTISRDGVNHGDWIISDFSKGAWQLKDSE